MRKGSRYISDEEPVFLAEGAGIVRELVLLGVHADKNENPTIKALWEGIAKKYNGLGITINTITYMGICTVLTSTLIQTSKYALGTLMLNVALISVSYESFINGRLGHETQRND